VEENYYSRINSSINDGLLNLSWKRYKGHDFKEYIITRAVNNGEVEVGRSASTHFIDSSYVGEGVAYYIRVEREANDNLGWASLDLSRNLKTQLMTDASEPESFYIKWGKSDYYNAVDSYQLYIRNNYSSYFTKVKSTHNPDDNSYEATEFKFNDQLDIKLRLVPRKNALFNEQAYYMFENSIDNLRVGFKYDPYGSSNDNIFQTGKDEFIYISGCYRMIRFSVSAKTEVENFSYDPVGCSTCSFSNIAVSASGKYVTSYVNCDHNVMLIKTSGMTSSQTRDLKPYSGQNYIPPVPVSDAGIVLVNNINSGFYLYDYNTSATLAYYKGKTAWCKGYKISPGGNYIYLLDDSLRLVRFENSKFSGIWSQPMFDAAPKYFEFDPINPEQLVLWDGARLYIKRCADFTTLYDFPLADGSIQNIDFYNRKILTYSSKHLYIRSLTDGTLIKDLPINFEADYYSDKCILVDNAICCISGVIDYLE
jgi:hypothetical protein